MSGRRDSGRSCAAGHWRREIAASFPAALLLASALVLGAGIWTGSAAQEPPRQQQEQRDREEQDTTEERRLRQQLPPGVSQAELIERLRQSGMTRSQMRSHLQQLGYDPRLVDQYYDILEQGGEPPRGEAPAEVLEALRRLGVAPEVDPDTLPEVDPDTLDVDPDELEVFGRSLFRRATTEFQPVVTGPVDPDFRLGPGDELILFLTGDVELTYMLNIGREGYIVIPDVGQFFVNGLTLAELRERLYDRLGRVYSGVHRGPEATTHFQVSLGRLRTNQVFVIGEVERPGAYQVSAAATVFNALYRAGGPTESGSFRHIQVRRSGRVVSDVDLYDYLLRGDSRADVRLEQGDIVFVPLAPIQARVEGAVRRPAIYELRGGEGLRDVVASAGGFKADAVVRRVQVDRIVPPEQRRPGVDRILVDVDVMSLLRPDGPRIEVMDGDAIHVFGVSEERRNRLVVTGKVRRPGNYEWVEGRTLWDLIQRADGLDERAYTPRAHIYRLNESDGTRSLIRTPLLADEGGRPIRDVALADRDSVVVHSQEDLRTESSVDIDGFVKNPGTYTLADGMTVQDLILAAGGFIHGADIREAEVARQAPDIDRTDTTAYIQRVPIGWADPDSGASHEEGGRTFGFGVRSPAAPGMVPDWMPSADEFELRHGDRVVVRRAPGYEETRLVKVTGQVVRPGAYVLSQRQERLTDIIERAGGLTGEAYAPGLQILREGHIVGTDLERALARPTAPVNVALEAGDSIHVPEFDPTVLVTGAVTFESRVLYQEGESLLGYIRRSGGFADNADTRRVSIIYPNGERETIRRTLGFTRQPPVRPGSRIFVPEVPPSERRGFDFDQFLARTMSLLTVLIAIDRLR